MAIETEFTPNPNSLKFNTHITLLESGSAFFTKAGNTESSPLAAKLLELPGVTEVLINRDFVTVTREAGTETWSAIIPAVMEILEAHLRSAQPAVLGTAAASPANQSDIERRIRQVLDEQVRPAVARDGGDIIFYGYQDGVVTLHLQGACSTCPSSMATLKSGVERLLCDAIPEVREVVQA